MQLYTLVLALGMNTLKHNSGCLHGGMGLGTGRYLRGVERICGVCECEV